MDRSEDIRRQLMATFQSELSDHLGVLNQGFLILEEGKEQPEQETLLGDLFRAAHSLKGAARAVNLRDIELISHRLEDILGAFQQGELSPAPDQFDVLFPALDALREAMDCHLRGESPPSEGLERLLAGLDAILRGDIQNYRAHTMVRGARENEVEVEEEDAVPPSSPVSVPPSHSTLPSPKEETIRVTTDKVDALMEGMGELLVARMRTEQRLRELQAIQERLVGRVKKWRQDSAQYKRLQEDGDRAGNFTRALEFLSQNDEYLKTLTAEVNSLHRGFTNDYNRLTLITDGLQDGVRRVRMLPISTIYSIFPRMVRDLARHQGKVVVLQVDGGETEVDRQVLELMKDPLTHLLRNAVDHGIEPPDQREAAGKPRQGTIRLQTVQKGNTLVITVADDGAGIDLEAVRRAAVKRDLLTTQEATELSDQETMQLIYRSGFSTMSQVTDLSGRGVGLDVVRENLEKLNGLIELETISGQGTTFNLTLPLTLATSRVLLVEVAGQIVALPTTTIERILHVEATSIGQLEGRRAIRVNGQPLQLTSLAAVLELPAVEAPLTTEQRILVVVLGLAERRVAFQVDGFRDIQEIVIKNLGRQLSRVRNVTGATILGTGQMVIILNVADLMRSAQVGPALVDSPPIAVREITRRRVMVVDDSITTRTLEKNILENAGYQVLVAADGEEAWALVQSESLDLIVADVAMPRMDGFTLTETIKSDERFQELPMVLVTSLETPQDKIRGMEAGADAYIIKSTFDQRELLETIDRLIR